MLPESEISLSGVIVRTTRFVAVALLALSAIAANAQPYPNKTIKVIVPFTPGSPVDAAARVMMQHLQARIGQSIIIENRPGGGSTIGTKAVATAPPDGYTLLLTGPQLSYLPYLYPSLDLDPAKHLATVATVATWSHLLAVSPDVPAKTVAELVAHCKANPGKLVFGYGLGTAPHILGETFKRSAGLDLVNVSYRGGEQARADLLGGRVHINFATVPSLRALIQDGKVRALGFTGPKRDPDFPNVPTMIESGLPEVGFNPDVWIGIMAPAGTPPEVLEKLNATVNETLRSPQMLASLRQLGFEPDAKTPQEFMAFLKSEITKWPPLLKAVGLKPED
jgi:tripartite-type tricarboxylate transporter receptor subunit TctC